jgi:hypothetical protein
VGRYGQAILTIAGTIIGAYFGYPALGAALGSLAGSLLFPTKLPNVQGPRLTDLTQTAASVGVPIPEVWGTIAVPGTVIHYTRAREVIESDEVGGGSGGPTQTVETPTYYSDFAISVCDCPRRPIIAVRRIQANGKWIYDRRPIQAGESTAQFEARMAANAQLDEIMTVYLGTDDQEPDPTLEAFYGVGNVSAHLQLAFLVFAGWKHKPEDGNRIPTSWKFEVCTLADTDGSSATEYSNEVLYPWLSADQPVNPRNDHTFQIIAAGGVAGNGITYTDLNTCLAASISLSPDEGAGYIGHGLIGGLGSTPLITTRFEGGVSAYAQDAGRTVLHYNQQSPARYVGQSQLDAFGVGTCAQEFGAFHLLGSNDNMHTNGFGSVVSVSTFQVQGAIAGQSPGFVPPGWDTVTDDCFEFSGDTFNYIGSWDHEIVAARVPREPDDPGNPQGLAPYPTVPGLDDFVVVDGRITRVGPWSQVTGGAQDYAVLAKYAEADVPGNASRTVSQYPLNPCVPNTSPNFPGLGFTQAQAFWEAAYEKERLLGNVPSGWVFGVHYPQFQAWAYTRTLDTTTVDVFPVQVSLILEDLCEAAGYLPEQIDTSGVDDLFVQGYARSRQMTARAAIDPLRQTRFFDGIENERTVRFVKRGGPIRHTFELDELGVFVKGAEAPTRISTSKVQDVDLPRQVRLHYLSYSRDYEPGQQNSPPRVDTKAVNDIDLEVAIVLPDAEAKAVAQGLWADAWTGRWTHEIRVSMAWKALQPTDCIAVPVDGEIVRCRILDTIDALPGVRTLALVRDDDGSYVPLEAPADDVPVVPPPLSIVSPAQMVLLDLPLIRDEDDDPGFYVAMFPLIQGSWAAAAVYRSTDGGGAFSKVGQAQNYAYTGTLLADLPAGAYATIDGENSIVVRMDNGTLDSITRAAMLNGGAGSNAAAVGADGRWEILQFQDVTVVDERTFILSTLLRGRRGTEWAIGGALTGDRFVLLTGPGIIRVPLQLSEIGREYIYRAVGTGVTLDSADDQPFIGHGVALKPFSPVRIRGERDETTGDWSITWIRRGRIGQTLQSGVEIPLSEDTEDYEVVIRDAFDAELRVISTSEAEAIYTGEAQRTDFGHYVNPLTVEIYQISDQVGRGYVGTATLSATGDVLGDVDDSSFVADSPDDQPMTLGGG